MRSHPEHTFSDLEKFVHRYRAGECRARVFSDIVLDEIGAASKPCTVLDIGCGNGFDNSPRLQESIARAATQYWGVEPDRSVHLGDCFDQVHHCCLEDAPLAKDSVDIAFCVMVLEHVVAPDRFLTKLHGILKPGGVFWGFTMDRRHYFCRFSQLFQRLGVKSWYLDQLHGERGIDRYGNYPTYYRCNSPEQVRANDAGFSNITCLNISKVGEVGYYVPLYLRPIARLVDRVNLTFGLPGSVLAVRLVK